MLDCWLFLAEEFREEALFLGRILGLGLILCSLRVAHQILTESSRVVCGVTMVASCWRVYTWASVLSRVIRVGILVLVCLHLNVHLSVLCEPALLLVASTAKPEKLQGSASVVLGLNSSLLSSLLLLLGDLRVADSTSAAENAPIANIQARTGAFVDSHEKHSEKTYHEPNYHKDPEEYSQNPGQSQGLKFLALTGLLAYPAVSLGRPVNLKREDKHVDKNHPVLAEDLKKPLPNVFDLFVGILDLRLFFSVRSEEIEHENKIENNSSCLHYDEGCDRIRAIFLDLLRLVRSS